MAEIRLMLRARHERWDTWEISRNGIVIGWVHEIHIRGTVNPFYRAVGIHQASGRKIDLERSTSLQERIATIEAFWENPMTKQQHLPWDLRI